MNDYDEIVEDELHEGDEELEDNPLYSMLTDDPTSGEDDDEEEDELDELEPEAGDSEAVLRTKLTAKNRILRQRAKTNTRLKDRVDELEAKLNSGGSGMSKEDIAALISVAKGGTDGNDEEAEQERIQALKDQLEEDPTAIVEILNQTNVGLENKLASILQNRDAYWEEKLNALTNQQEQEKNPEVMRLVGLLRQKEEYKDLDEAVLVKFAKDLAPLGNRVKRPPATTRTGRLPIDAKPAQVEKAYASELDRMGYGSEND